MMLPINVRDHGARGDGSTKDTAALQRALDAAALRGGGRVVFPDGLYLSGTLQVGSNTHIELRPGALLQGSPDIADYPLVGGTVRGDRRDRHLLVLNDAHGVRIDGGGIIDGAGPAFWEPQTHPLAWMATKPHRPSPMILCAGCSDLVIENLTLRNSPGWTLHLHVCDRVRVCWVKIVNPPFGPNTDGINIDGCQEVEVTDCRVETGADAIAIKTSGDARGCRDIRVANCLLRSNCVALKLGAGESFHDMRQIEVRDCVVQNSHRPITVYSLEGAVIEDVTFRNIVADTACEVALTRPIHLELRRRRPDSRAGAIRGVRISNFTCLTEGRILIVAEPGMRIDGVELRGIRLVYPTADDPQAMDPDAGGAELANHNPEARRARAAVVAENVRGLDVSDLEIQWPEPGVEPGAIRDVAWVPPVKAVNGTRGTFGPESFNPGKPTPFSVLWGRGLEEGRFDAGETAPYAGAPRFDLEGCSIRV
jgi:hypothetical protein